MKRVFLSIILCLTLVFALVGCSKDEGSVELGSYDKIEVAKADVEVTDEDVQEYIDTQLSNAATTETQTEGTVAEGDTINISYTGYVDGETFEGGSSESSDITVGSSGYIDGFDDGLIGAEVGSTVDLNLTFPDPYENNTDLSGKAVLFETTINSKNVTITPELTDEWVANNYSEEELTTVDAFKAYVREYLEDDALKSAVWNAVIEDVKVNSYNKKTLEAMVKEQKDYYESYISSSYGMELSDYLSLTGSTEEDFDKQIEDYVKNYLKQEMTANAIAKKENLSVSDDEYNNQLQEYADQSGYESVDAFKESITEEQLDSIKLSLLLDKVLDVLIENVEVVDTPAETTTSAEDSTTAEAE